MTSETESGTELDEEEPVCTKCGEVIEQDNEDSFLGDLCFGCSHGQDEIDGFGPC